MSDNTGYCKTCEKLTDEIERLRGHVELLLEGDGKAQDEIERLRGLLEDACRWHEQFPIQRVREALGE